MKERRRFLKMTIGFLSGLGLMLSPFSSAVQWVFAKAQKTILPRGTKRRNLIDEDPALLDTRNLHITPLKDFDTMGISDYDVDLDEWRLEVRGHIDTPLEFTYTEILALSAVEKEILLICPGFFTNHGRWKGFSMVDLLERAGLKKDATHVIFSGPEGAYERVESFPVKDVLSQKVFLAYGVNGEALPKKHGFPLRLVAEGHYGYTWIKYVYKMKIEKGEPTLS